MNWVSYAALLVIGATVCGFLWSLEIWDGLCLILGILAGAVLRDFGMFRRSVRAWPVQADMMDWRRVENLLVEPPDDRLGLHSDEHP